MKESIYGKQEDGLMKIKIKDKKEDNGRNQPSILASKSDAEDISPTKGSAYADDQTEAVS